MRSPSSHRDGASLLLLRWTRQFCLELDQPLPLAAQHIPIPPALERAVPRRQTQFRAGRYCALRAMEALDPRLARHKVERSTTGAPAWPPGITGSITHTDDFASAAVASTAEVASLGIDTERVLSAEQARDVGDVVASSSELQHCHAAGITPLGGLTLVFSAKESIFKCLHPLVGRMFEFHDVRLVSVDVATQTFRAEIVTTLGSDFSAGTFLEGRFALEGHRMHTGISIETPEAFRNQGRSSS
nr:PPTase4 [uncultured bacterium]